MQPAMGTPAPHFPRREHESVLNREQPVFGYELLFRNGIENLFRATAAEAAGSKNAQIWSCVISGRAAACGPKR
jgi:hypothetical protein